MRSALFVVAAAGVIVAAEQQAPSRVVFNVEKENVVSYGAAAGGKEPVGEAGVVNGAEGNSESGASFEGYGDRKGYGYDGYDDRRGGKKGDKKGDRDEGRHYIVREAPSYFLDPYGPGYIPYPAPYGAYGTYGAGAYAAAPVYAQPRYYPTAGRYDGKGKGKGGKYYQGGEEEVEGQSDQTKQQPQGGDKYDKYDYAYDIPVVTRREPTRMPYVMVPAGAGNGMPPAMGPRAGGYLIPTPPIYHDFDRAPRGIVQPDINGWNGWNGNGNGYVSPGFTGPNYGGYYRW